MSDPDTGSSTSKKIYINNFDEDPFKKFYEEFTEAESKKQNLIPIIIDSFGGYIYSALAMNDMIRATGVTVSTFGVSKAMSCGSFLLAAGTPGYRYCSPNCVIMVHGSSAATFGKLSDMEIDVDEYRRSEKLFLKVMSENCGHNSNYFSELIKKHSYRDIYLTPQQALKHRIIDKIGVPFFREKKQTPELCIEV